VWGETGPGPYYDIEFLHGHNAFSEKLYAEIVLKCPKDQLVGYGVKLTDETCKGLIADMYEEIGGYFVYGYYDDCWYQNSFSPPSQ